MPLFCFHFWKTLLHIGYKWAVFFLSTSKIHGLFACISSAGNLLSSLSLLLCVKHLSLSLFPASFKIFFLSLTLNNLIMIWLDVVLVSLSAWVCWISSIPVYIDFIKAESFLTTVSSNIYIYTYIYIYIYIFFLNPSLPPVLELPLTYILVCSKLFHSQCSAHIF